MMAMPHVPVRSPYPPLPARPVPPAREVPVFPPLRVRRGRFGPGLRLPGRRTAAAGLLLVAAALLASTDLGAGPSAPACRSVTQTAGRDVP
ncbi:hypothetical protein [Streptomyces meridianus]|uniref:Uncharacterized protein n=1 Tax=Streptomyces meridianus TaxID=2938945 RepID=A0ABT0XAV6_9ACTN|nr:hypothetical protein [Streptomyces meridianus]MCM2579063.1 hypothetical protein [Streptomyces meridianus]